MTSAERVKLESEVGQLLVVGFPGLSLTSALRSALSDGRVGGAILFSRNIENVEQVLSLNQSILDAAGDHPTPFIAVDQEGGRVQRLREPLTRVPPMYAVGQVGDADYVARIGEMIGDELAAVGFNLDFAPCADVWTEPENKVIGDRSFGDDPESVGRYAGALALGLTMSGVIPCAKHFPGHGDTLADSHLELPVVGHDIERLHAVELAPFRALIRAKIPMIMTAHLLVPAIDTHHPVTLSENGIGRLLRQKMGYGGVVITDDLEMNAVAERYSVEEMVTLGLRAGVDIFLICHTEEKWQTAFQTLVRLGEENERDRAFIALAAGRVARLKAGYLKPCDPSADPLSVLGSDAHQVLVKRVPL